MDKLNNYNSDKYCSEVLDAVENIFENQCEYCLARFENTPMMRKHLQYCERGPSTNYNSDEYCGEVLDVVENVFEKQCEYCLARFENTLMMMKHIQNCERGPSTSRGLRSVNNPLINDDTMETEDECTSRKRKPERTSEEFVIKKTRRENNIVKQTWYDNRIKSYTIQNNDIENLSLEDFFESVKKFIKRTTLRFLKYETSIKLEVSLSLLMTRTNSEGDIFYNSIDLSSDIIEIFYSEYKEFPNILKELFTDIITQSEEYQERESGWAISRIFSINLNLYKFDAFNGGHFIKLPTNIEKKKACLNIKNYDDLCFKYCVIAYFLKLNKADVDSFSHININDRIIKLDLDENSNIILNFENLKFPLTLNNIKKFEEKNPTISVNVFGIHTNGKKVIGPLHKTNKLRENHINLLFLNNKTNSHYVLIKDMSRLVRSQITSCEHKIFTCDFCLIYFNDETSYKMHKQDECNKTVTKLPVQGKNITKFEHYERQLEVPFVTYADFESRFDTIKICANDPNISSSTEVQIHRPTAYSYLIKCSYDSSLDIFRTYSQNDQTTTEDCVDHFVKSLYRDIYDLYTQHISKNVKMILTPADEEKISKQIFCHICNKALGPDRVRDHCHLTGSFRGLAHNSCNLKFKVPGFFPIFCHNLSRYDGHIFITALNKSNDNTLTVIPQTKETYISFTKLLSVPDNKSPKKFKQVQLRFLDSYRFLPSSLENLAKTLNRNQFNNLSKYYPNFEDLNIYKKGVFPYEYLDSSKKLLDTSLPSRRNFYSKLKNQSCSLRKYRFALRLWDKLGCQTLEDYLLAYLQTDVLLLTDIFENFRKVCLQDYKLDPCHYITAPSLSWDAMLKFTKAKLELLTDINMYNFFQKGIRGGLTQCCIRHVKASNKYIKGFSSKNDTPSYLLDFDANNLYGYSMGQYLPFGSFRWLNQVDEWPVERILNLKDKAPTGYVFEVDLEYPESLHNLHNCLPFCPQKIKAPKSKEEKLMATLNDKERYIIHYRHLKLALKSGLLLKKVHRVLAFSQSNWLQSYIDFNTFKRATATNDFHKDFYKLLNNSVYGKTMENIDKRKDVKIALAWESQRKRKGARALIASPFFHSISKFNNNMSAIQSFVVYDKPIYVGFTILEESKLKMYSFHYEYMKPKFQDKLRLVYTDTDSFIYVVNTDDFYEDIRGDLTKYFDTSNYPKDNIFNFELVNKKVIGCFKDENAGKIMLEFVGLKSKMYSFTVQDSNVQHKRAKGIPSHSIKHLTINDYKNCIYHNQIYFANYNQFKSKLHTIYTLNVNKLALSKKDDKRFILNDGISTLAWGHFNIPNM